MAETKIIGEHIVPRSLNPGSQRVSVIDLTREPTGILRNSDVQRSINERLTRIERTVAIVHEDLLAARVAAFEAKLASARTENETLRAERDAARLERDTALAARDAALADRDETQEAAERAVGELKCEIVALHRRIDEPDSFN